VVNIYVTAVAATSTRAQQRLRQAASLDLVPWADPYIVGLVESLKRGGGRLPRSERKTACAQAEAAPPLYVERPHRDMPRPRFKRPSGGHFE